MRKRGFGSIRKMSSGRYQARYTGPDAKTYTAPATFERKGDADTWLAGVHTQIAMGEWKSPEEIRRAECAYEAETRRASILFSDWADQWLESLPRLGRSPKTIGTWGSGAPIGRRGCLRWRSWQRRSSRARVRS